MGVPARRTMIGLPGVKIFEDLLKLYIAALANYANASATAPC
jgi:hypothetical protein